MIEVVDDAIEKMIKEAKAANQNSQKALHFSQAALNLANVRAVLKPSETEEQPNKPKGSGS